MFKSHRCRPSLPRLPQRLLAEILAFGLAGILAAFAEDASKVQRVAPGVPLPLDTSRFRDSASHWRHIRDTNRVIQASPDQPAYAPEQVREIAANLLLFQRDNGGWPKDYDMLAILTDDQKAALHSTKGRADTSFDNHNLHSQVDYLARAFAATDDASHRDACVRGFDFILAAQYPNGGFPQRHPNPKGYSAHITFNDGVMMGILGVLKDAADGRPHFAWLDAARREQAREAVKRGVECILKCQIRVAGKLTGWCQQHDEKTYEARPARTFELASICPQDTTEIVRFLMQLDSPGDDVVRAVDAAVEWLRQVKLSGVRVERVKATPAQFERHDADFDVVVVPDEKSPPLWARHYEIGTNRPVFAGRDAVKRYALAEVERERRTGSVWYGRWPEKLLENEYPQWRAKIRAAKAQ